LLPFVAEQLLGLRVHQHNAASTVDDHHGIGGRLQELRVARRKSVVASSKHPRQSEEERLHFVNQDHDYIGRDI